MYSLLAYFVATIAALMTHSVIFSRYEQKTVDSSNDIPDEISLKEIRQLLNEQQDKLVTSLQAIEQRLREHDISLNNAIQNSYKHSVENDIPDEISLKEIRQLLNEQQDKLVTSLQAMDQRLREHDISLNNAIQNLYEHSVENDIPDEISLKEIRQLLNEQQDKLVTSLQAMDQRLREHDISLNNAIQNSYEHSVAIRQLLNEQQDKLVTSLQAMDQRLREHDISLNNAIQNSYKLSFAYGSDLGEVPIGQPTVNDWIVLMSRFDESLDFSRSWAEYKNGFGDIGQGDFWLGNEKIHRLTNRFLYRLHIEVQLKSNGQWYYANYDTFSIDSEGSNYALRLSGFSGGTAGDSLINTSLHSDGYHGGMSFSTFDADNDRGPSNCAQGYEGGWWFNHCHSACLTCTYDITYFQWYSLKHVSPHGILRAARMMIKSK